MIPVGYSGSGREGFDLKDTPYTKVYMRKKFHSLRFRFFLI